MNSVQVAEMLNNRRTPKVRKHNSKAAPAETTLAALRLEIGELGDVTAEQVYASVIAEAMDTVRRRHYEVCKPGVEFEAWLSRLPEESLLDLDRRAFYEAVRRVNRVLGYEWRLTLGILYRHRPAVWG